VKGSTINKPHPRSLIGQLHIAAGRLQDGESLRRYYNSQSLDALQRMRQHLAKTVPNSNAILQLQKLSCVGRMLFHHHTDISKVVLAVARNRLWLDLRILAVV
jgi:hypothetical protein